MSQSSRNTHRTLSRSRAFSLRLTLQINMALIAVSAIALVLYIFFIAQAVFFAALSTDTYSQTEVLASKVALLERDYLAQSRVLDEVLAGKMQLVAIAEKTFVETPVVSRADTSLGL